MTTPTEMLIMSNTYKKDGNSKRSDSFRQFLVIEALGVIMIYSGPGERDHGYYFVKKISTR